MLRPFRFGVTEAHAPSRTAWVAIARRVEELGYATLLILDRMNVGSLAATPALAVAAAATTSLHVGSYVFCNGYRHPVLLAREAATLDLLSDGRFEPGLGTGVSSSEFQQMGIPFGSAGARVDHLAETLQIMKRLFTEETVSFTGKYYTITEMKGYPKPQYCSNKENDVFHRRARIDLLRLGSRGRHSKQANHVTERGLFVGLW